MLVTGKKIDSMDMVSKPGLIMLVTKETMNMEKNMELELSNGQMALLILESFTTIISMAKASILGLTIENTKATGEQTKCTAKVLSIGQMEESMLENTPRIRRKAMENSFGPMADAIEVNG